MAENAGPQQPNETDAQYMRRMGRVSREKQRQAAEARKQDRIEQGAYEERERKLEAGADKELGDFIQKAVGASLEDIQKAYNKGKITDSKVQDAVDAVKKAQRGRATKARNRRVKKAIAANKGTLKKAGKKTKGCAVIAVLLLLGVAGGAGWAVWEAGSAIVSAIGG